MKRLILTLISLVSLIMPIIISAENIDIDETLLKKINSLGIKTENIDVIELDPKELMSYTDFSNNDFLYQQKDAFAWSTIWNKNLSKLDVNIKSSTVLKGYPVLNLLDKKIETAWVEGTPGNGIDEWVSIELSTKFESRYCPNVITCFGITPGYLKSDKTWEENNLIKTALLIVKNDGYDDKGRFVASYYIFRLNFEEYKGIQIFDLTDYPVLSTNQKIWLFIEDVIKGTKYNDTCISELFIRGSLSISNAEPY